MSTSTELKTIDEMKREVYDCNVANGWFEDERPLAADRALLHSEISEMLEAYRDHGLEDMTGVGCPSQDFPGHLCKPEGVGSEAADILIRILDTAHRHPDLGLSLPRNLAPHTFMAYEKNPTFIEHIDMMHRLVAGVPARYALSTPLQYLHVWVNDIGIDLMAEYERKLAYNLTRGYKHGGKLV